MIRLQAMTEAEFAEYKPFLIEDYAQEIARNQRIPIEEARLRAASQTDALLEQGITTPNQFIYNILFADRQVETPAGYLWVEVNLEKKRAYIYDIFLHEQQRGRGLGQATLEMLEAHLRGQGVASVGLYVFADNQRARRLYEKLGFQAVGTSMTKRLVE